LKHKKRFKKIEGRAKKERIKMSIYKSDTGVEFDNYKWVKVQFPYGLGVKTVWVRILRGNQNKGMGIVGEELTMKRGIPKFGTVVKYDWGTNEIWPSFVSARSINAESFMRNDLANSLREIIQRNQIV
jgi:hypothetical protein